MRIRLRDWDLSSDKLSNYPASFWARFGLLPFARCLSFLNFARAPHIPISSVILSVSDEVLLKTDTDLSLAFCAGNHLPAQFRDFSKAI